jgi:hypothetical protein
MKARLGRTVLLIILMGGLGACSHDRVQHASPTLYYLAGIPEVKPDLIVNDRRVIPAQSWRWQSSTGLEVMRSRATAGGPPSLSSNGHPDFSFDPYAPPVTLRVTALDLSRQRQGTHAAGTSLVSSGVASLVHDRSASGCIRLEGKSFAIELSARQWARTRLLIISALWLPLRYAHGYEVGSNQVSWVLRIQH